MRILITNDDGINARGLAVLNEIATDIAGPEGEVWTVAPAFEQSGVGHATSHAHPRMLSELGPRRFAAEGSPADCVLAGLHDVLAEAPPDLVLSGVNRGNNSGENVVYSGTVGGAMEGALQGVRSIALSQYLGPDNARADDPFSAARAHGAALVRALLDDGAWGDGPYAPFYNINFPPVLAPDVRGIRITPQGRRPDWGHTVAFATSPAGRRVFWVTSGPQHGAAEPGSDVAANLDGYISVTPLQADLTAHGPLSALAGRLDRDFRTA